MDDAEYENINPYEETDPRHAQWELRYIHFRKTLIETAKENGFKKDTMDALKTLLSDIMSQNAILSNQTPPTKTLRSLFGGGQAFNQLEYTKLSIQGVVERFLCNVHPTDKQKDIIYQMIADVVNHTENFTLTRTVGDDREGIVNRIEHTKTTQEVKQYEQAITEEKDKKRKGIF